MSLIEYWREFTAIMALLIGIIAGRKSKDFKEKVEGAGAIAALQKIYEAFIEHNKEATKDLVERVKSLERHNRELQKHLNEISFSYATVMDENRKMEAKYKELQAEYTAIKLAHEKLLKEFNEYKTKLKP